VYTSVSDHVLSDKSRPQTIMWSGLWTKRLFKDLLFLTSEYLAYQQSWQS